MNVRLRLLIILPLACLIASCGVFSERKVDLPATPILSGGSGWAIVTSSYVRLKKAPGVASEDLTALRDHSLVEIIGREFDPKDASLWYEVRSEGGTGASKDAPVEGWVPESSLDIYAAKEQAERALAGSSAGSSD